MALGTALAIGKGLWDFGTSVWKGQKAREGQREQNEWSAAQAQRQMDFQQNMSSTAFQRSTQDMRSAGLNPMLAIMKGGASSPSGAMGQGSSPTGAGLEAYESSRATNAATAMQNAQTANIKANTAMVVAKTPKQEVISTGWKAAMDFLKSLNKGSSAQDIQKAKRMLKKFGNKKPDAFYEGNVSDPY